MKKKAPRNRTIELSYEERLKYEKELTYFTQNEAVKTSDTIDKSTHQDIFELLPYLADNSFDFIFADPPYNLDKRFGGNQFKKQPLRQYQDWLQTWIPDLVRLLKPEGSLYVCGDWRSSSAIHLVLDEHAVVRNRITFEREKGRGAKANWKNCSEDIWFATKTDDYYFDVEAVKLKRKVLAPYRKADGAPKDWDESADGNFRLTHPSNLWTDITIPFWSMPENTDHPTQKPEKLVARLLLASCPPGGLVFDPFAGAGTTAVVARKLGRHFLTVELEEEWNLLARKRLALAETDATIQGYQDGVFWERNAKAGRGTG